MSISKTKIALFVSLLLALSTTASIAHNLYYHDANTHQNDVLNQFVDYGHVDHHEHYDHKGHDSHDESSCVFTVIQYSESLLAHEIPAVSLPYFGSKKLSFNLAWQIRQPDNGFFARAPPTSV